MNDRMIIGAFNDPNPSYDNYRLLKESGINTVIVNRRKTKEQILSILDYAEKLDLGILVDIEDTPEFFLDKDIYSKKAFLGYHVFDEPTISQIDDIEKLIEPFNNEFDGSKIFFCNLCTDQWGSCLKKLGARSYYDYVKYFIDKVLVKVKGKRILSVDSYPFMYDYNDLHECLDNRHLEVLELFSMLAKENNFETHLYIQTMGYGKYHRKPELSDFRLQFITGFAYGFKSFTHFCYYTPGGASSTEFDIKKDYAMVFKDDELSDIYYSVKEANAEAQIFYKVVKDFEYKFTSFIDGDISFKEYKGKEYLRNSKNEIDDLKRINSKYESLISINKYKGKNAYIIVNFTDPFNNLENEIHLEFNEEKDIEIRSIRSTNNYKKIKDISLIIPSGEGLVIIEK